jgi:aryl-alcohol dehydrogenase-like predicted oxidoreductase
MGLDDNFPEIKWSAAPDYIESALEASLSRLGTDYLDLYQLHFPDAATPLEDTIATLHNLRDAGKIREFGCSNFTAEMLRDAHRAAAGGEGFRSVQNQYSLLHREPEDGVLDACDELGMGLLPFYPLANGMLTDKYIPGAAPVDGTRLAAMPENRRGHWLGDDMVARAGRVHDVAREAEIPVLTLAFSWLLSHRQISSVIAGASNADQVAANVAAITNLSDEVLAALNAATA